MKNLLFIQLVVVCGLVNADPIDVNPSVKMEFAKFQQKFGKKYFNSLEKEKRMAIFQETYLEVQRHNAKPNVSFLMGINQFSDLTQKEFADVYLNLRHTMPDVSKPVVQSRNMTRKSSPVDWRRKKNIHGDPILTNIKNQGQCGSCWAFSAVQTIESYYAINGGRLTELSPQHLVSCDKQSHGCNGGLPQLAFEYVKNNGGINSANNYPYKAQDMACEKNVEKKNVVKIGGHKSLYDRASILYHLENEGPISVCLQASDGGFQKYYSGIMDWNCGTDVDHAVQLVGWGEEGGKKYWIVRNSWGKSWGEEGYIRMQMDESNAGKCGILQCASYPTDVEAA